MEVNFNWSEPILIKLHLWFYYFQLYLKFSHSQLVMESDFKMIYELYIPNNSHVLYTLMYILSHFYGKV